MSFRAATLAGPTRARSLKMARASSKKLHDYDCDLEEPVNSGAFNTRPTLVPENGSVVAPPPVPTSIATERLASRKARLSAFLWMILLGLMIAAVAMVALEYSRDPATREHQGPVDKLPFPAVAMCLDDAEVATFVGTDCTTDPLQDGTVPLCHLTDIFTVHGEYNQTMHCQIFNEGGTLYADAAGQRAILGPTVQMLDREAMDPEALSVALYDPETERPGGSRFISFNKQEIFVLSAVRRIDLDEKATWTYQSSVSTLPLDESVFDFSCDDDDVCAIRLDLSFSSMEVLTVTEYRPMSFLVAVGVLGGIYALFKAGRTFALTSAMVATKNDCPTSARHEYANDRAQDAEESCGPRCGVLVRNFHYGL